MFSPTSTISVSGWMLQTVTKNMSKQTAQALTSKGNQHKGATYGTRNTEAASFTLGGTYETGNMTLPQLGSTHITDFTVKYSETAFPSLDVNKDDAATSANAIPSPVTLPVRSLGVPASITDIYTAIGSEAVKELTVAVSAQHAEDLDGSGAYGTLGEFRDVTVQVTFTGVSGKPQPTMATGWTEVSNTAGDSNTAVPSGSTVYEKHFPVGTDTDAENYVAASS